MIAATAALSAAVIGRMQGGVMLRSSWIGVLFACLFAGCGTDSSASPGAGRGAAAAAAGTVAVSFACRGAWFAPRGHAPLDSARAVESLAELRRCGATHVAIGHEVTMPSMREPVLEWGQDDAALVATLRAVRAAGMQAFLLPRIESPDFFRPPYPFRADIGFADAAGWERFHAAVEKMLLHYGRLAAREQVAVFGLGLELKQSVRAHPERWRRMAQAVRAVYPDGALTYSANWYDEWEQITFWDALDFVGVGAYFELEPRAGLGPNADPVADIAARWTESAARLAALSRRVGRPVLFTEIGYAGFADCVERPWEWAGKMDRGAAIDHRRQAEAYAGLFRALGQSDWLAGMFVWTWYSADDDLQDWEYALQGRPAESVFRRAYGEGRLSGDRREPR